MLQRKWWRKKKTKKKKKQTINETAYFKAAQEGSGGSDWLDWAENQQQPQKVLTKLVRPWP